MTDEERDARHAAYRAGFCADCKTSSYSAGRIRCTPCHTRNNPHFDAEADRDAYPCRTCGNATRPGSVLCYGCYAARKAQARR